MTLTHRNYLKIAIPFIIATITQPLLGAVDTAVVGRLGSAAYIGGVAVGTVMMNTIYWLFGFYRVSTTGHSALALGRDDEEEKAASLIRPFLLAAITGLLFILLQALIWRLSIAIIDPAADVRAQASIYFHILIWGAPFVLLNYVLIGWLMGQAMTGATLFTQVFGNVLNIVLDLLFVLVFEWDVTGVAAASLISQVTTFLLGMGFVLFRAGLPVGRYLHLAKMGGRELRAIFSSNSDLFIRTICILVMFNSMARVGASFGTTTLAGNSLLLQLTFIASYFFDGLANASSVFSGKAVGARDATLLGLTWRRTNQWTLGFMVLMMLVLALAGGQLARLFTDMAEILAVYDTIHLWGILFPAVAGFGLTWYGIFTGSNTTRPIRNSTVMAVLTYLAALLLFTRLWGNQGLWAAVMIFYVGRAGYLFPYRGKVERKIP